MPDRKAYIHAVVRNDKFDSPLGKGLLLAGRGQSIEGSVAGSLVELSRR